MEQININKFGVIILENDGLKYLPSKYAIEKTISLYTIMPQRL